MLANFSGDVYKSQERAARRSSRRSSSPARTATRARGAVERGRVLGESCNIARDLCNEPANVLTPSVFAERGAEIGRDVGLHVEVLDEDEIARLQMGLLLGVARGSAEPPRVIVMRHEPPARRRARCSAWSARASPSTPGGISIKPAEGMDRMKDDMAGGAAVIGAMRAIALQARRSTSSASCR